MSAFYHCIMCHCANISIADLHNHHINHHNAKELSQTIINLKGFRIYHDIRHVKQEYLEPVNLGDNNNNEGLYKKTHNSGQMTKSPTKCSHDKTTCSMNCSQFIAWEHELNKRTEINDEEFFNIIESLCCDLSKRKRRGRKKKLKIDMDKIEEKEIELPINTEITNTVDILNTEPTQIPTTSFYSSQDIITNISNNEVIPVQTEYKAKHTENIDCATGTVTKSTDPDKTNEMCTSIYNNFSWRSIIVEDIDQDLSAEGGYIYTKSMEPTIENLLS